MAGAIGYVRVSSEEQARENNSQAVQGEKITTYCTENNVPLVKIFTATESARTMNRPTLQQALSYCREHRRKISHFIVADLSRLARNAGDQAQLFVTMQQLGIELVSIDDPVTDDTAVGKLARNMVGALNQFHSDSLSEKTRYRMECAARSGRFLWPAPIGYINKNKQLHVDPDRGPLIREAFELIASGRYATADAVLKMVTALGLTTRKGRKLTKQTFGRMITNPIYAGWIVSGEIRVRGKHTPLVSDELFERVQTRISGKATPHKRLNEDFPLRGSVLCATCKKPLTAGWAKGRKERYPRYWCWTKGCRAVGVSREHLERHFVGLLSRMEPTAKLLADLPNRVADRWRDRKEKIAAEAARLAIKMAEQKTLNQMAIKARVKGDITKEDFETMKNEIADETKTIQEQISALDSEQATMKELTRQAEAEMVDLVAAWNNGNVNQRQELAKSFFPDGLVFSHERGFFEPANTVITEMVMRWMDELHPCI